MLMCRQSLTLKCELRLKSGTVYNQLQQKQRNQKMCTCLVQKIISSAVELIKDRDFPLIIQRKVIKKSIQNL